MASAQQDSQKKWSFHLRYNGVGWVSLIMRPFYGRVEDKLGGTTGAEYGSRPLNKTRGTRASLLCCFVIIKVGWLW